MKQVIDIKLLKPSDWEEKEFYYFSLKNMYQGHLVG